MKMKLLLATVALVLAACAKEAPSMGSVNENTHAQAGVFGGDEVSANDMIARTTVGLYNTDLGYICTGSLYGKNLIITAAHCLEGNVANLQVRFGVDMRAPLFIRKVLAGKRNPRFTGEKIVANMGDIALLKYEGTIPTEYGFRSVSFLNDYQVLGRGSDIIAAGYGIKGPTRGHGSGLLRQVTLEVKDPGHSGTEISVKQGLFRGVCNGDSGGPAFFKGGDGKLYIWGITSSGAGIPKVRSCMFRSVFTRIDAYSNWIQDTASRM